MEAEAAQRPSGDRAQDRMGAECPERFKSSLPVPASQSFNVASPLPDSNRLPSGENAPRSTASWWPAKTACGSPEELQSRTAQSRLPEAIRLPPGENTAHCT